MVADRPSEGYATATRFRLVAVAVLGLATMAALALAFSPDRVLIGLALRKELDGTPRILGPEGLRALRTLCAFAGLGFSTLLVWAGVAPHVIRRRFRSIVGPVTRFTARLVKEGRSMFTQEGGALALATALGFTLRVVRLNRPIEFDEATTSLFFTSRTFLDAVSDYRYPNNHVVHSVLSHFSTVIFGPGEAALRLPTLVAGTLLIPVVGWAAWRTSVPRAATVAAWLTATVPALVFYGSMARGYTLAALFSVLALVIATFEAPNERWTRAIIAGVLLGLAIGTIPTMLMAAASVASLLILTARGGVRTAMLDVAALAAVTAVAAATLYSPILFALGPAALVGHDFASAGPGWRATFEQAALLSGLPPYVITAVALGVFGWSVVAWGRHRSAGAALNLSAVAGVVFLVTLVPRELPARVLIPQLPLFLAGSASLVLASCARRWRSGFALIVGLAGPAHYLGSFSDYDAEITITGAASRELRPAIRYASPLVERGFRLAVDVSEGLGDPARYYARLEGLDPWNVLLVTEPARLRELATGTQLVLISKRNPQGEGQGRNIRAFLASVADDPSIGRRFDLGVPPPSFEGLSVIFVVVGAGSGR